MVAVLFSPAYGAGWFSWNTDKVEILFHPKLVEMVEANRHDELTDEWIKENVGRNIYSGGVKNLEIRWLPEGTVFRIEEHDGYESIVISEELYVTA